ncbi:MAG: alpha/beta hydrolase [Myxococcales bacterium]|nr:alpha/beta hydrolase [Myxococcales bacterium]
MRAPFDQLPFGDVPDKPRLPHRFFDGRFANVTVSTRPFGPISVRTVRYGSGPPLVLVHGFMTTAYSFRYLFEPLADQFELVAFDLVGAGETDKPRGSYHPDRMADAIGDTLDALGVRGAPMIGNSLGGYLALRLALRDPGAIGRLSCLHPPGLPTARMVALRAALDVLPRSHALVRWLVRRDERRWVHKNVHYFDETLKSREEHGEYARPLESDEGLDAFVRMLDETMSVRAMRDFERDLAAFGSRFPIPLQLVYARRDPMVPPIVGQRLGRLLPSAELVWLENASHFAHVDNPAAFLRAAIPFLTREASGAHEKMI